jgi:hypothetical protein
MERLEDPGSRSDPGSLDISIIRTGISEPTDPTDPTDPIGVGGPNVEALQRRQ